MLLKTSWAGYSVLGEQTFSLCSSLLQHLTLFNFLYFFLKESNFSLSLFAPFSFLFSFLLMQNNTQGFLTQFQVMGLKISLYIYLIPHPYVLTCFSCTFQNFLWLLHWYGLLRIFHTVHNDCRHTKRTSERPFTALRKSLIQPVIIGDASRGCTQSTRQCFSRMTICTFSAVLYNLQIQKKYAIK